MASTAILRWLEPQQESDKSQVETDVNDDGSTTTESYDVAVEPTENICGQSLFACEGVPCPIKLLEAALGSGFQKDCAASLKVRSCTDDCNSQEGEQDGAVIVGRQSWSMGAEGHAAGTCRPCGWNWKETGCEKGISCEFCHMCDEGALKRRHKMKKKATNAQRWLDKLEKASVLREEEATNAISGETKSGSEESGGANTLKDDTDEWPKSEPRTPPGLEPNPQTVPSPLKLLKPQEEMGSSSENGEWAEDPSAAFRGGSWSIGAEGHATFTCRPCVWVWKGPGCQNGSLCEFCHMCGEGAVKKRQEEKLTLKKKTEKRHSRKKKANEAWREEAGKSQQPLLAGAEQLRLPEGVDAVIPYFPYPGVCDAPFPQEELYNADLRDCGEELDPYLEAKIQACAEPFLDIMDFGDEEQGPRRRQAGYGEQYGDRQIAYKDRDAGYAAVPATRSCTGDCYQKGIWCPFHTSDEGALQAWLRPQVIEQATQGRSMSNFCNSGTFSMQKTTGTSIQTSTWADRPLKKRTLLKHRHGK